MMRESGGANRTIHTRSVSAGEGRMVGSDEPSTLPDNFGPKTIESLPANFLIDPDSVGRRRRSTLRSGTLLFLYPGLNKQFKTCFPTLYLKPLWKTIQYPAVAEQRERLPNHVPQQFQLRPVDLHSHVARSQIILLLPSHLALDRPFELIRLPVCTAKEKKTLWDSAT